MSVIFDSTVEFLTKTTTLFHNFVLATEIKLGHHREELGGVFLETCFWYPLDKRAPEQKNCIPAAPDYNRIHPKGGNRSFHIISVSFSVGLVCFDYDFISRSGHTTLGLNKFLPSKDKGTLFNWFKSTKCRTLID